LNCKKSNIDKKQVVEVKKLKGCIQK